ncbi:TetR family transcriptional regulator [Bacillus sp. V-88]|jgi:AcrR family transcriptional regulator|uniref:TetR/AcrR family transcriptional regulator n=1 Tax=Rossellomorea vietnamensis TaxID=218284 RepID=UPI000554DD01|nr:TetR/AcrR family transcriptional regulator [Rossellomorea vietnamensis]OXS64301.1 TetR family transcriptional regulator [Bacillus sp. DSM 27956]PRX79431.1 TetR family transcriptional regulator [Bacillus sp. V-88]SLJ94003.1 transcriptional regulator, TetR family [Bacillus sp. V-88]
MKEKEKLIIETSIKLFATKGFNATSVQEIVNECDISKGAFYLYFKSKEALLLAIMNYYFTMITDKVNEIENEDLSPYDKFQKQLECQLIEICKHKEFIIMQIRENAMPFNDEIHDLLSEMKMNTHRYYRRRLFGIYGKKIEPYFWDITMMIQGFFHSYLELVMLDKIDLDFSYLSHFILRRTDDLVDGLLKSGDKPVLSFEKLDDLVKDFTSSSRINESTLIHMIQDALEVAEDESIRISLEVIREEIQKDETRPVVIKGMLVNLAEDTSMKHLMNALRHFYQIQ